MVDKIDFFTSFGYGDGGNHRRPFGIDTRVGLGFFPWFAASRA